jgi:hypothetical protein
VRTRIALPEHRTGHGTVPAPPPIPASLRAPPVQLRHHPPPELHRRLSCRGVRAFHPADRLRSAPPTCPVLSSSTLRSDGHLPRIADANAPALNPPSAGEDSAARRADANPATQAPTASWMANSPAGTTPCEPASLRPNIGPGTARSPLHHPRPASLRAPPVQLRSTGGPATAVPAPFPRNLARGTTASPKPQANLPPRLQPPMPCRRSSPTTPPPASYTGEPPPCPSRSASQQTAVPRRCSSTTTRPRSTAGSATTTCQLPPRRLLAPLRYLLPTLSSNPPCPAGSAPLNRRPQPPLFPHLPPAAWPAADGFAKSREPTCPHLSPLHRLRSCRSESTRPGCTAWSLRPKKPGLRSSRPHPPNSPPAQSSISPTHGPAAVRTVASPKPSPTHGPGAARPWLRRGRRKRRAGIPERAPCPEPRPARHAPPPGCAFT